MLVNGWCMSEENSNWPLRTGSPTSFCNSSKLPWYLIRAILLNNYWWMGPLTMKHDQKASPAYIVTSLASAACDKISWTLPVAKFWHAVVVKVSELFDQVVNPKMSAKNIAAENLHILLFCNRWHYESIGREALKLWTWSFVILRWL